jgi:ubiquinol-cytochrome c reductase cytochrome c1 subunit
MKSAFIAWLLVPTMVFAASGEIKLDSANIEPGDTISLQRGATTFVNYCLNCHSAAYMRYNKLTDLGLSEQQIMDNLIFSGAKVGDSMKVAMRTSDGKTWFGVAPPDLSVVARSRGADWLYTYLRTFYRDETRALGWNNLAFPNTAMPHVLWRLQGTQGLQSDKANVHAAAHNVLVMETPGTMNRRAYNDLVRDLVNFLVYMGEPGRVERVQIGIIALLFLGLLIVPAWLMKREYWNDVH